MMQKCSGYMETERRGGEKKEKRDYLFTPPHLPSRYKSKYTANTEEGAWGLSQVTPGDGHPTTSLSHLI